MDDLSRRTLLAAGAVAAVASAANAATPIARPTDDPAALARNEDWWRKVGDLFDRPPSGVVQLENGHFGAMARPVRLAYEQATLKVNRETTLYTRGPVNADLQAVRVRCARLLGVGADEITFSRNTTESMAALIGQYNKLKPGDAVLYADLDYDSMQSCMETLGRTRGVRVVKIALPEPASRQTLVDVYEAALKANPDVRMMLLTHLSHRTGLVPPVKEIAAIAKARNVDVLLDGGHALGQTEFDLRGLGVPFIGLNLHKWIGSPLGVGLIYIAKDRIPDIDVSQLEPPGPSIDARLHTGTVNFAAQLCVADAIDFHESVGLAAKAHRLRYLRDRWAETVRANPAIEVLTPNDPALHAGITSFRIKGKTTPAENMAFRKLLFDRHKVFTVERLGPARGACIRVSPSFINSVDDVDVLVKALTDLTKA